jgi:uncharacterized protein (TIGR03086 family)
MGKTPHGDVRARWCDRPMRANGTAIEDGGVSETRRVTELIALGRDREAAELGVARSQTSGGPMDVRTQLDELGPLLAGVVGGLSPADLDRSTACAEFSVRGVLEHMIGGATMFAAAFRGEEPSADAGGDDVLAAFGPALTGLAEAINSPGALDRTVQAPFGEVPGETFARFVVLDGLVHGWDMATATGQAYQPSDTLVADVESFALSALDPLRDGTTFAAAVEAPASATAIERLAALTGRRLA